MLQVRGSYLWEDERPFFWLGDTAWLLWENLDEGDIAHYIKNRAELGFNVIQSVLFYSLPDQGEIASGMPARGKDIFGEDYLSLVERSFELAREAGVYIALLPCWGSYVKKRVVSEADGEPLADFLVRRFGRYENLVWVLGGDVKGEADPGFFHALGNALKARDREHLITFHPFGRTLSARWFAQTPWCDFHMFQSGHRRYDQAKLRAWDDQPERWYGEDNWRYVEENATYIPVKPCLDAEPSYEGIVQGLHDLSQPYWEAADVRRYAYWSVFAGACGFTYGNNAIIQFYTPALGPGAYGVRESWQEALHAEGGGQLRYLKELMEEADFTRGRPAQERLLSPQGERYHRVSVFAGADFLLAYTHMGDSFELSLEGFAGRETEGWWMDPRSGERSYLGSFTDMDRALFRPARHRSGSNDWVLILRAR